MLSSDRRPRLAMVLASLLAFAVCAGEGIAQTTAFTYQGKLTDGGNPANGNYDLQFALFDSSSGGTQTGSTLTRSSIPVSGGIFTVQLDFGVSAFPEALAPMLNELLLWQCRRKCQHNRPRKHHRRCFCRKHEHNGREQLVLRVSGWVEHDGKQ